MNSDDIVNQASSYISSYRQQTAKKFLNPYFFGLVALYYGYRGKLGPIERFMLGAAGAVTIYQNYQEVVAKNPGAGPLDHLKVYAANITGGSNAG